MNESDRINFHRLIECATLAPSGHNTQPWRFRISNGSIELRADLYRRLPVVDPDDHALYISLGCALENLVIAAEHDGLAARLDPYFGDSNDPCIRVHLAPGEVNEDSGLYPVLARRQSNRRRYNRRKIKEEELARLLQAGRRDAVELRSFAVGSPEISPIIEFVREGNRQQFSDRTFVEELVSWVRFSRREVQRTSDGLFGPALGFPPVPRWLGKFIMTRLLSPESEAKRQARAIDSSSHLLLFIARNHDKTGWIETGRAFQRVALTATLLGMAHAHVNMPCEVPTVRSRLAEHLGLVNREQPLLLIRIGYAQAMPRAPRRPVEAVLD
jgi:hypothetical protein